jgi:hypothetical protein
MPITLRKTKDRRSIARRQCGEAVFESFYQESSEIKEELEYLQEIKPAAIAKFFNEINKLAGGPQLGRPASNRFCPVLNRIRPGFHRLLSRLRSARLERLSTGPDRHLDPVRWPLSRD